MRDAEPSRTALATAFLRALHMRIDETPPVLDDAIAWSFLPGYQQRFVRRLAALAAPWQRRFRQKNEPFTAMRAHIVVRARYTEDALAAARADGAVRYVVLAAGLDSFAWRQAPPTIAVTEIDHPATQAWKQSLVAERGLDDQGAVSFLAVDFERDTLAARWTDADGVDFVSWLGATYYLSRDAIAETLRVIAERSQPGSRLVLDFWSDAPLSQPAAALLWSTRAVVALQQEPMRSFFEPPEIAALAADCGWRVREHCAPDEQNRRYLAARSDNLAVPAFAHLLLLER